MRRTAFKEELIEKLKGWFLFEGIHHFTPEEVGEIMTMFDEIPYEYDPDSKPLLLEKQAGPKELFRKKDAEKK